MSIKEYFQKRKEEKARIKREKWELANLNDEQKEKYSLKTKALFKSKEQQINFLIDSVNRLETKYDILRQMFLEQKSNKKTGWRAIQSKDGETEWVRQGELKYVSSIYTTGPENAFYFDVVIDGQKITFSAPTKEEAAESKLRLLDVERVEEFDESEQQERFGSKKA